MLDFQFSDCIIYKFATVRKSNEIRLGCTYLAKAILGRGNKTNFVTTKYFFMLLFSICLPLPMKETTPLREITFNVYCGKTFMSPDGLISSVGTSFKTCKTCKNGWNLLEKKSNNYAS